jgi:hypothetical protein
MAAPPGARASPRCRSWHPSLARLPDSQYRVFTDAWSMVDQASGQLVSATPISRAVPPIIDAVRTMPAGDFRLGARPSESRRDRTSSLPVVSSAPGGWTSSSITAGATRPTAATAWRLRRLWTLARGGCQALTISGFDGDAFQARLALVEPLDCGDLFLGSYIALASTKAQVSRINVGLGEPGRPARRALLRAWVRVGSLLPTVHVQVSVHAVIAASLAALCNEMSTPARWLPPRRGNKQKDRTLMTVRTVEVDLPAQTTLDQAIVALLTPRRRDVPGDATLVQAAVLLFEYTAKEATPETASEDVTPEQ